MPLSFKKCCPQCLSISWFFCIKFLSSHVEHLVGKFFHSMRYSEIGRFHSCRVIVSVTAPSSNMIFPSSSSSHNIVWIGIFCNFWMSGHTSLSFFHLTLSFFIQFGWIIETAQNNASTSSSFFWECICNKKFLPFSVEDVKVITQHICDPFFMFF